MLNELVRSLVVPPLAFGDGGEILGRTEGRGNGIIDFYGE